MNISIYCQSYDISCSWGSWFDVSSFDDFQIILVPMELRLSQA